MRVVLCYDISDNTRRARLFKKLKAFLLPVQESVFEGHVPPNRMNPLLALVKKEIDHSVDTVRIIPVCRACGGQQILIGISPAVREPEEPIII